MPVHSSVRKDIIRVLRLLYDKGYISSFSGNISVRIEEGFIITPSGKPKYLVAEDDLVQVLWSGSFAGGKASSEWRLHYEIYRTIEDANAVVHAHPPFTTSLASIGILPDPRFFETEIVVGRIALIEALPPGSAELAERTAQVLAGEKARVAVLKNHGVVSYGPDVHSAFGIIDALEEVYRMTFLILLGNTSLSQRAF